MSSADTIHDSNIIRDGWLPLLREDAVKAIKGNGVEKLSAILRMVDDARLLDAPQDEHDWPASLLEWAVYEGSAACARVLVESGADPSSSRLLGGLRAVHLLARQAQFMEAEVVLQLTDLLSRAGADFDAKDADGWTPLHHAISNGSMRMATILIERGVWIDPKLLDDPEMDDQILPDDIGRMQEYAIDTLRDVRAMLLGQKILSAMPDEGAPAAKSSPAMTL